MCFSLVRFISRSCKCSSRHCTSKTRPPQGQVAKTSAKLTPRQTSPGETKLLLLNKVLFASGVAFSGSDSIVVEQTERNFLSRRQSIDKSERSEMLFQNHKVEASQITTLKHACVSAASAFETYGHALVQPLRLKMSSEDSIRVHVILD